MVEEKDQEMLANIRKFSAKKKRKFSTSINKRELTTEELDELLL